MNTNWAKILLFSLLAFAMGFMVSRLCGSAGCHRSACAMERSCHGGGHGQCDGHSCCKGGEGHGEHSKELRVRSIVKDLETAGFQGDTTIAIDNGTVQVARDGEKVEVRVEVDEKAGRKPIVHEEVEVTTEGS